MAIGLISQMDLLLKVKQKVRLIPFSLECQVDTVNLKMHTIFYGPYCSQ